MKAGEASLEAGESSSSSCARDFDEVPSTFSRVALIPLIALKSGKSGFHVGVVGWQLTDMRKPHWRCPRCQLWRGGRSRFGRTWTRSTGEAQRRGIGGEIERAHRDTLQLRSSLCIFSPELEVRVRDSAIALIVVVAFLSQSPRPSSSCGGERSTEWPYESIRKPVPVHVLFSPRTCVLGITVEYVGEASKEIKVAEFMCWSNGESAIPVVDEDLTRGKWIRSAGSGYATSSGRIREGADWECTWDR